MVDFCLLDSVYCNQIAYVNFWTELLFCGLEDFASFNYFKWTKNRKFALKTIAFGKFSGENSSFVQDDNYCPLTVNSCAWAFTPTNGVETLLYVALKLKKYQISSIC
jgi:hypothetical protein